MGLDFCVSEKALIPRKETEVLGYAVVMLLEEMNFKDEFTLIDVCTGMGNIALSIASRFENAKIYGSDITEDSIVLAKHNSEMLKLQNRVSFSSGDLLNDFMTDFFFDSVDIITCNPPYISSMKVDSMPVEIREYEPHEAFDGGKFGISILVRLLNDSLKLLKDGGWLCFEIGLGQADALIKKIERMNRFSEIKPVKDEDGNIRALLLRKTKSMD